MKELTWCWLLCTFYASQKVLYEQELQEGNVVVEFGCLDAATAMVRRRVKPVPAPCVNARGVVVIGLKVRRLSTLVRAVERLRLKWWSWRGRKGFRRENRFLISFRRPLLVRRVVLGTFVYLFPLLGLPPLLQSCNGLLCVEPLQ